MPKTNPTKLLSPLPIAIALTVLVLGVGGWVGISKCVWELKANEIGDFFSGFAGALAFVWIVATIFLQKEELEVQREQITEIKIETRAQTASLLSSARTEFLERWHSYLEQYIDANDRKLISTLEIVSKTILMLDGINEPITIKFQSAYPNTTVDKIPDLDMAFTDWIFGKNCTVNVSIITSAPYPNRSGLDEPLIYTLKKDLDRRRFNVMAALRKADAPTEELISLVQEALSLKATPTIMEYNFQQFHKTERLYSTTLSFGFLFNCAIREIIDEIENEE